jgi:DnaJ-class molecular chaperone
MCWFKKPRGENATVESMVATKCEAKGKTLYVRPSEKEETSFRMMKAIKGEGMPLFKNSMTRGNLFVDITVEFPDSIDEKFQKELRKIFNVPELRKVN